MSGPLTPEELAAMEARCEAATPGPWNDRDELELRDPNGYAVVWFYPPNTDLWEHQGTELHDANFIAHARTDVPRLIAEVKRLREREGRYRGDLDSLYRQYHALSTALLHAEQALERGDTQEAMRLLGSAQAGEVLTSEELEQIEAAEEAARVLTFEDVLTPAQAKVVQGLMDHTHRLLAIVGKFRKGVE